MRIIVEYPTMGCVAYLESDHGLKANGANPADAIGNLLILLSNNGVGDVFVEIRGEPSLPIILE